MSACFTTCTGSAITASFMPPGNFPDTSKNGVSTGPGQTAVTKIPFSLSSAARLLEKLSTYDFVAA